MINIFMFNFSKQKLYGSRQVTRLDITVGKWAKTFGMLEDGIVSLKLSR